MTRFDISTTTPSTTQDSTLTLNQLHPDAGIPRVFARPEVLSAVGQKTLRDLMRAWFAFERRLGKVPVLKRLDCGTFTREDYLCLLRNLRPQVIEGARWIARCASSFDCD